MGRILIVDDEDKIRYIIKKYAAMEGHETVEAASGEEAIALCEQQDFDVVLLDVMMPGLDGFSACRIIREKKDIPIIMLSARGEEYDRIHGFELGVDDYVVKPFSPKELMMRIQVVLKRHNRQAEPEPARDVYQREGLVVDFTARIVTVDGVEVDMTPREYDLLFYMVRNRGIALTRERLLTAVWGYDYDGADRTLDTHIKLLRSSLGPYRDWLVTLRGVGYRFEEKTRS